MEQEHPLREDLTRQLREKPSMMEAINGDGHGLYSVEWYTSKGWESAYVAPLNVKHVSDGTVKGSMFDADGNIIKAQVAVYSLSFHYRIADIFGIDSHLRFFGRGTAARHIAEEVRKIVDVRS